jgi:hypothetical protein
MMILTSSEFAAILTARKLIYAHLLRGKGKKNTCEELLLTSHPSKPEKYHERSMNAIATEILCILTNKKNKR